MSFTIIYIPEEPHKCGNFDHNAVVGTIGMCDICGKTWVYKIKCDYGIMCRIWEPESKFARWRRERKERKCPATCLD